MIGLSLNFFEAPHEPRSMVRKKMDHKGHPKKPLERNSLPIERLVEDFCEFTEEEDPQLVKKLRRLKTSGRTELAGILGRFDFKGQGALDTTQRLLARRVLLRLHRFTDESLVLTNKILDYLDLNQDAVLDEDELNLCVEILELFAHADSDNETLSEIELKMLYGMLRHLDSNNNKRIDPNEKARLRAGLEDPKRFLAEQRANFSFQ
jgi:hypothetical protein